MFHMEHELVPGKLAITKITVRLPDEYEDARHLIYFEFVIQLLFVCYLYVICLLSNCSEIYQVTNK